MYWTRTQFHRQSLSTTEHTHNSTDSHSKLLDPSSIPPSITKSY